MHVLCLSPSALNKIIEVLIIASERIESHRRRFGPSYNLLARCFAAACANSENHFLLHYITLTTRAIIILIMHQNNNKNNAAKINYAWVR